jgi:hypothetical protein
MLHAQTARDRPPRLAASGAAKYLLGLYDKHIATAVSTRALFDQVYCWWKGLPDVVYSRQTLLLALVGDDRGFTCPPPTGPGI